MISISYYAIVANLLIAPVYRRPGAFWHRHEQFAPIHVENLRVDPYTIEGVASAEWIAKCVSGVPTTGCERRFFCNRRRFQFTT